MNKQGPEVIERMPFKLTIPPWYPIFLGTEQDKSDYLVPVNRNGRTGWMMTTETWQCNPSKKVFRRTPSGFGMMGHQIITSWGLTCIVLYDGRKKKKFPEYIRKEFEI